MTRAAWERMDAPHAVDGFLGRRSCDGHVIPTRKLGRVLLAWACAPALFIPSAARANCAEPAPKLIWSYPADGATNVPTNAHIFVLPSGPGPLNTPIEVNGTPIAAAPGSYGFAATLAPQRDYEVVVRGNGAAGQATPLRFGFRTGDGPAPSAPLPSLDVTRVNSLATRALSPLCEASFRAMDCFDTGQDTHLIFETAARPTVFFIEPISRSQIPWTMQWPGECGDPEIFVNGRFPGCLGDYLIVAVGPTGESAATEVKCAATRVASDAGTAGDTAAAADSALTGDAPHPLATPTLVRSQGCSVGGPSSQTSGAPAFGLLAFVFAWWRASRRRADDRVVRQRRLPARQRSLARSRSLFWHQAV